MANEITLTLYNNKSAPNVVYKNKTQVGSTMTGQIIENLNLQNVIITIPYFSDYALCNYAYIPEFKRYYFCKIEVLKGERLKLTMKSDALSSFWGDVKYSQCIARRSSSSYNPDIKDDYLVFKPQPKYVRRKTSAKFTPTGSGGCYVLTIGGK